MRKRLRLSVAYEQPCLIAFQDSADELGWGTSCVTGKSVINNYCGSGYVPAWGCPSTGNVNTSCSPTGTVHYNQCCSGASGVGYGGPSKCSAGVHGYTDCIEGSKYSFMSCNPGS